MVNRSMTTTIDRMLTLNRALDEAFTSSIHGAEAPRVWVPAIDLIEKKDSYVIRAELPGVERSNLDITFEKNVLTISGRKNALTDTQGDELRVFAAERVTGGFSRSLRLPDYIDGDKISADFRDGLLTITVPKAEMAQPRKITITG